MTIAKQSAAFKELSMMVEKQSITIEQQLITIHKQSDLIQRLQKETEVTPI